MEGCSNHAYPCDYLAVLSDDTYVYAIGGRFLSTCRVSIAFELFYPKSGAWTKSLSIPASDESFGVVFTDGLIVVVGGEKPT
ncbi:hypothetical protein [Mycobacterium uberis]|uniref:hypothetical protein n=1 Tax=Mycobacterium uberis TaxID=2162698 RepID=UPI000E3005AF|nr:hypothetical protein [Mycobacterium uberis]